MSKTSELRVLERHGAHMADARAFFAEVLEEVEQRIFGRLRTAPKDHVLHSEAVSQAEVCRFLEAALPDDLARLLVDGGRTAQVWVCCPELWTDGLGRPDLTQVVIATRRAFLEARTLATPLAAALESYGAGRKGQQGESEVRARELLATFPNVLEHLLDRHEPWAALVANAVRDGLHRMLERTSQTADGDSGDGSRNDAKTQDRVPAEIKRAITSVIEDVGKEGTHGQAGVAALSKLALFTIPGLSLVDVREIVIPAPVWRDTWAQVLAELRGTGDSWLMADVPGGDEDGALHDAIEASRVDSGPDTATRASTKWTASPEIRAEAIRQLWCATTSGTDSGRGLRKVVDDIHNSLRRRFKQTQERSYHWRSLPFRLLAAGDQGALASAVRRCIREVLALRTLGNLSGEAFVHRELAPHAMCIPSRGERLQLDVVRLEYWTTTVGALFAVVRSRSVPLELMRPSLEHVEAIYESVGKCLQDQSPTDPCNHRSLTTERMRRAVRDSGQVLDLMRYQLSEDDAGGGRPSSDSLDSLRGLFMESSPQGPVRDALGHEMSLLDPDALSHLLASPLVNREESEDNDHPGGTLRPWAGMVFLAQLLMERGIADAAVGAGVEVRPEQADDGAAGAAAGAHEDVRRERGLTPPAHLLRKALSMLESPFLPRPYLIVRFLLSLDLRLMEVKSPDLTFLAPIIGKIRADGGRRASQRLEDRMLEVSHLALLHKELLYDRAGDEAGESRDQVRAAAFGESCKLMQSAQPKPAPSMAP